MQKFTLDTNVFIQAHRSVYPMDIFPAFWDWLESQFNAGILFCSSFVYDEIKIQNELSDWSKSRKSIGLNVTPDDTTSTEYSRVANYVVQKYGATNASGQQFLGGADGWVIAAALAVGAIVVTQEKRVDTSSKKVKIPNICAHFHLECINTIDMLRRLGAKFR